MKETILKELDQIERREGVKILFACESGSRGWGFPSPDSDFDARFIYVRGADWYLSIEKHQDYVELPICGELDINGWDIKKALQLMFKSNATLFEWLQSPIVYRQEEGIQTKLFNLCKDYFNPRICMHHYLGLAKRSMLDAAQDKIKIKGYFYVLRPLLAAMWIAKYSEIPPMEFKPLLEIIGARPDVLGEIHSLLERKKNALEKEEVELISPLQDFIHQEYDRTLSIANGLEKGCIRSVEPLNQFFRDLLANGTGGTGS